MSATTRAFDVVPFGVVTTVVWSQAGAPAGHPLLEEGLAARHPPGNRSSSAGRPAAVLPSASAISR